MRLASNRQPIAFAVVLLAGGLLAVGLPSPGGDARDREAVAAGATVALPSPRVLHAAWYPRLGVRALRPDGWKARRRGHVLTLRAPDGTAAVTIAVQPRWVGTDVLRRRSLRAVRRTYEGARRTARRATRLGTRRVGAVHFDVRRERPRLDVAVIAASSRWRSYAVTAARSQDAPAARVLETRAALRSISFARPLGG